MALDECEFRIEMYFFFREGQEEVKGKLLVTVVAAAEVQAITGDSRGARDEINRVKSGEIQLWDYKLHFSKQGLFNILAFQNLHKLINFDIKSYLNLCTFAMYHLSYPPLLQ